MFEFSKLESYILITDLQFENISAYIQSKLEKYSVIDSEFTEYFKGAFIPQYCIMDLSQLNPETINLHNNNKIIIIAKQYSGLQTNYTLEFDDELEIIQSLNLPVINSRLWLSDYRSLGLLNNIQIKKFDKIINTKYKTLTEYFRLKKYYFSKVNPDLKKYYLAVFHYLESGRN